MVRHPDKPVSEAAQPTSDRTRGRLAHWWFAPLPAPPERLRRGPLRPGAFPSPLRSARLTSLLGIALGVAFGVCFGTGLLSHLVQHPPGWFWWPSRPAGLYRVTQGVHVAAGLACVPLLGVKLWSVYPRLFAWPPVRSPAHAAERAGVALLVAAALFQVISGVLNVAHWYAPMPFFFTTGHYRVAWLVAGALLVHIGVQLPVVREALRRPRPPAERRRQLLAGVGGAIGLITLTTAGQTWRPLRGIAVLAPRRPDRGPQGLPVNRTAAAAGTSAVGAGTYRLSVTGPGGTFDLDLTALYALPQHTAGLPITCVEGWSADATWSGVRLADLVELAGADPRRATVLVESLETAGRYRASTVAGPHTRDPLTLIALRLNGAVLDRDHGFPARLIAPNRPGVLQTKWVGRLTVREEPCAR
ncbi:molybdopterin-binding protein [Paractinoplanes abujensis]|uniref:DMSO/TMAO reductase YedYZ molybdopterin-dependent catalytic subunit n=1 Tax=Paractinoplanes abujensis TaxID=882441 RepID=A0A7W7G1L5_9ACTN|nr:molybdopterin-dependent oxidoreductase [Actinoplanes abujensis]MBB4692842.1 DMSO/TMAO reductase YedYZ molybdopterin-dependent catalytic subunit [Actinoplanes abujensis]GID22658.1 molybdopterin-binding protein [Actinoplanes abujensis]